MDFMGLLGEYYSDPLNMRNPLTKKDLLALVPNVFFHRTFINDEKMSMPKTSRFTNIPQKLRLTTICVITCSLRRKKGFSVDMFLSEIIYADSKLFRRHFYHMGIIMESNNMMECITAIGEMKAVWPERKEKNMVDIYPRFYFPNGTPKKFKDKFVGSLCTETRDVGIGDWEDYINGIPSILKPNEPEPDWIPPSGIFWADIEN